MAVYDDGFAQDAGESRVSNLTNFAGAALSLALIIGVGVWGYKLVVRDVSGIPVVRAMEGDMRVAPENPGGEIAPHAGLAVNEVAALGEAVTGFALGDKVVSSGFGGMAEFFCAPAANVRKLPDIMSAAQGAAFGSAYITAYVSLVRRGMLEKDEWLLVHGAAGGVGLAAVDLGKQLGAKVIATASKDEKLAAIEAAFAPDALINVNDGFREKVKELTGGGADVIYDPVGGDVFDESVRCIAWGGRLLVVGFANGRIPEISVNMPLIKGFSVVGVRAGEYGRRDPVRGAENQKAIWDMAAKGQLRPHVHAIVPLSDWRDAFHMMQARDIVGRVILDPRH